MSWIKPLDNTGNAIGDNGEHLIGTWKGQFSHWNLSYLRPGLTPHYVHKKKVAQRKREGWKIATPDDARQYEGGELDLSGAIVTENLVLMVAPTVEVEARRQLRRTQARDADKAATTKFLEGGSANEADSDGRPIRFQTADHGSAT